VCLTKINLEKVQERWWDAVLVDEPKISVRKIDSSRPITDLDDESQVKIEELVYNERQKALGLPQSHEKVSCVHIFRLDRQSLEHIVTVITKARSCIWQSVEITAKKHLLIQLLPLFRYCATKLLLLL